MRQRAQQERSQQLSGQHLADSAKQQKTEIKIKGIFRLVSGNSSTGKDDQLTYCLGFDDQERPTDFSVPIGSNRTLVKLKRVGPAPLHGQMLLHHHALGATWARSTILQQALTPPHRNDGNISRWQAGVRPLFSNSIEQRSNSTGIKLNGYRIWQNNDTGILISNSGTD